MKIDRLLSITIYLLNRKKATARELADRFEVSRRTIQRDIDSIAMAGIPIYADRGKDGGYRLIDDYTVDRQYFDSDEIKALSSFVKRLNMLLKTSDLKNTEEKLACLANSGNEKAHDKLIMDFTPWGMDEQIRDMFERVYKAVEDSRVIHIDYAAPDGKITKREVEPLSVIIKGSAWYLWAYCRLRSEVRIFKITRIISAIEREEIFNPEIHPPYRNEKYMDEKPLTLFVLRFTESARGRITDYYSADRLQLMPDGSTLGFFPFPEDEWVYSWILSFGPLVKVLEPKHAKDRIKELVNSVNKNYS